MIKDYHKILGLERDADLESIKKAYRELAKKYHPDINKSTDAHKKFIEISEAYEFLSNNTVRQRYISRDYDLSDEVIRTEFERARRAAQENAQRYARMKYEKFQEEQEALKKSGWYDIILIIRYFIRLLVFPLVIFCIAIPFISKEVSRHPSGYVAFWILALVLIFFVISNWKNYFRLGAFFYSFKDLKSVFDRHTEYTHRECYYCKGLKADSLPYRLNLFKIEKIDLQTYGALYGRKAGIKRSYKKIEVPRSRKAFFIHSLITVIKILSIILCLLFIHLPPLNNISFFIGMFLGIVLSMFVLMIFRTRSKVSYLLSYGILIKLIVWIISVYFFRGYAIPFLLFFVDPILEAILRYISGGRLFSPFIRQYPETDFLLKRGYQLYLELPVWSTLNPFFRWMF
jgi:hypothetical protein